MKHSDSLEIANRAAKDTPARRLQKKIKFAILIGLALAIVWFFVQFGFHVLPAGYDAGGQRYAGGKTLMYDRFFDYHEGCSPACDRPAAGFKQKNVAMYRGVAGGEEMALVGQIVGLPGEMIKVKGEAEGGGQELLVGSSETPVTTTKKAPRFEEGPIPDRSFFILNYNRKSKFPDSREFGLIKAEDIVGKVIVGFKI